MKFKNLLLRNQIRPISAKLGTMHPWVKGIQVFSNVLRDVAQGPLVYLFYDCLLICKYIHVYESSDKKSL